MTTMTLSKETLETLKNMASVSVSVGIPEGKVLKTHNAAKTLIFEAELADAFPKQVSILDMNNFLASVALFKEPVLDFSKDNGLRIKEKDDSRHLDYAFAVPDAVPVFDRDFTFIEKLFSFELSEEKLKDALNAATLIGARRITFDSDGQDIRILLRPSKSNEEHIYSEKVGKSASGEAWRLTIELDLLASMSSKHDYTVEAGKIEVNGKKLPLVKFSSNQKPLTYMTAIVVDESKLG